MRRGNPLATVALAAALCGAGTGCEANESNESGAQSAAPASAEAPASAAAPAAGSDGAQPATNTNEPRQEARGAVEAIDAFIESENIDKTNPSWRVSLNKPPQAEFDASKTYFWILETNHGQMKVKLLTDVAPMHASSTIYLTRLGFYDGLGFHRVISGFMAQGGDPLGNGRGGPGYQYAGEFDPNVKHDAPGKLSMANAGPGTDGSQFFLTFVETPHLDGKHTVFGEITEGMGTLRELEARGSRSGAPSETLEITRATIAVE